MSPDQSIAHYRIVSKLGEGGMGEVWRATDTKLGRDVAIKIIPEAFAQDPDRMARFTREAQLLASLNHPNIAAIHGVEARSLILELVEGPTLAERIEQGAIPLEEALPIAKQIAEALEYAHDRGIVHRDLKPANIKVTPEGRVKVLDFGLAKALGGDPSVSDSANSPTMTMRATLAGLIMGTAGYMSPEQAKGKPVDRRADIWAFGVVLVEMLTGRILYHGETVSETLASVIKDQPDLATLPDSTPSAIRRLLKRCLNKDPLRRLQAIGEARIAIDEAGAEEATPATAVIPPRAPRWMPRVTAALLIVACVLGVLLWRAMRPVEHPMMRFSADLGPDSVRGGQLTAAISPDGRRIAFGVRGPGGVSLLATRLLDQAVATVLAGTEGAQQPFFSPDSQWIGFFTDSQVKKISVQGGAAVTLCGITAPPRGGSWGDDGNIIADIDNFHLSRIPSAGGPPVIVGNPEAAKERSWRWPQVLPGSQTVLFTATSNMSAGQGYETGNIEVLSLKTGAAKVLYRGGYYARYLPSGHLAYVHQGSLFAAAFDLDRLELRGTPVPVLDDVAGTAQQGGGQLDFSLTGTFVYLNGKGTSSTWNISWLDFTGKTEPLWTTTTAAVTPRLSPDGKLVAASTLGDLTVYDPARAAATKLTFNGNNNRYPVFSPDGKRIYFSSDVGGEGSLLWVRADGASQPQKLVSFKDSTFVGPTSITADGRRLAFFRVTRNGSAEIWTLPLDLSDPENPRAGTAEPFLTEPAGQSDAVFSPDGRWIAYASYEGARSNLFVRPFPGGPAAGKWLISNNGGRFPVWSRNGRELFYVTMEDHINVVHYETKGSSFIPDKPMEWSSRSLTRTGNFWNYDIAPDGKRFIIFPSEMSRIEGKESVHVTVLLNFFDELKRKLP